MNNSHLASEWMIGIILLITAYSVVVAVAALFIQASCRLVMKFTPPYPMAMKAAAISTVVTTPFRVFTGPAQIIALVISFAVSSFVIGRFIKNKEGIAIGSGKGAAVAFGWMAMGLTTIMVGLLIYGVVANPNSSPNRKPAPMSELSSEQFVTEPQKPLEEKDVFNSQKLDQSADNTEQKRINDAIKIIQIKYPMLDEQSPSKNQNAIDVMIELRNQLITSGIIPSQAMLMAADQVYNQLRHEQERRNVEQEKQVKSATYRSTSDGKIEVAYEYKPANRSSKRSSINQKPSCAIKPVMTDEELARCR